MGKLISKSYKIGLIERQSITTHRNIRNAKTLNKCIRPCVQEPIHLLMNELHRKFEGTLIFHKSIVQIK